ncbi:MAG: hypothetical protein IJB96_10380 [Lachnospira sp.]|nr:hypothetical protein [Lachnospira sp.]
MNEKSLEVLEQYDIDVRRVSRGRGGMILSTGQGLKLFLECVHPDAFYKKEDMVTKAIKYCGYELIDTYMTNKEGEIITTDEEGRRYILKNWFEGRECNNRDIDDICDTLKALAKLHIVMEKAAPIIKCSKETESELYPQRETESLYEAYMRHTKELKMASNYLRTKKRRQDFEMLAYGSINTFYNEARDAMTLLEKEDIMRRLDNAVKQGELSHGSFNYHNVMFVRSGVCITNFDKVKNECQIVDLYQFMRKILEKYDWNIELAYKMIDEYDKIRMVTEADLEILAALFAFPEKYWKIINHYFNMNKAWIPPKSIEKLNVVIEQNVKRKEFIETLFA